MSETIPDHEAIQNPHLRAMRDYAEAALYGQLPGLQTVGSDDKDPPLGEPRVGEGERGGYVEHTFAYDGRPISRTFGYPVPKDDALNIDPWTDNQPGNPEHSIAFGTPSNKGEITVSWHSQNKHTYPFRDDATGELIWLVSSRATVRFLPADASYEPQDDPQSFEDYREDAYPSEPNVILLSDVMHVTDENIALERSLDIRTDSDLDRIRSAVERGQEMLETGMEPRACSGVDDARRQLRSQMVREIPEGLIHAYEQFSKYTGAQSFSEWYGARRAESTEGVEDDGFDV